MSPREKTSFEDHLNIVEAGQDKTASAPKGEGTLLDKLASELGIGEEKTAETKTPPETGGEKVAPGGAGAGSSVTDGKAPAAEGEVQPAASSVSGAAPAVVAATEGVATPQTEIAGGNAAEAAAGEEPAATKPNEGLAISAGDGVVTDANQLHKTPAAVVEAAKNSETGQVMGAKTAEEAEAIGKKIAETFQVHLEKTAQDQEYTEALNLLKEGGILEGYNIKDEGLTKEAGESVDYLQKIANKEQLSREDIVGAAYQTLEMEKEAEEAEAQGREDAQNLVAAVSELMTKQAGGEASAPEANAAPAAPAAPVAPATDEQTKLAKLMKDEKVVDAVRTLKEKNLL